MQAWLTDIYDKLGITCERVEQVLGGDINQSFCLHTKQGKFFVKLNDAEKHPAMFAKEAEGLGLLAGNTTIKVPAVLGAGEVNGQQWLMLEWMEKGRPSVNFWQELGAGLAGLHGNSHPLFGLDTDNYIGTLRQSNKQHNNWPAFYLQERIYPLCKMLFDTGSFSQKELTTVENGEAKLQAIFPAEPPALLHGDLWAGNFMTMASGSPAIFDPAVYYGHREMDIGMTMLFGGFDQQMYKAYDDAFPLEKSWKSRLPLTQLYPLLVHAVLFGGHYIQSAAGILTELA